MLLGLKRRFLLHLLRDPAYRFLFDPPPQGESVSIDCETTGLNTRTDDIVTVAAVKIRGNRILTSERFEAMVKPRAKLNPTPSRFIACASRMSLAADRSRRYCRTFCGSSGRGRWSASISSSTLRC